MDDFLLRALLGGIGVALVAGPLGSFVVWRRMAYFGDTLAHSALLGIALGFVLGVDTNIGIIAVCLAIALILVAMQHQKRLATDTILGILSHSALSLGLVTIAFLQTLRVDLMAYLFGDILAIMPSDLYWIYGGGLCALLILALIWHPLLAATVHEELARVEGVPVTRIHLVFMLLIALIVAVALKIVGVLLITSLMIIPAATARRFAHSPEQMAVGAALIGSAAVAGGLYASFQWDTPAGPSVVVTAAVLFVIVSALPSKRQKWNAGGTAA